MSSARAFEKATVAEIALRCLEGAIGLERENDVLLPVKVQRPLGDGVSRVLGL